MKAAVGLPNIREYADPSLLVALAEDAEAAGWDGLFLWDHLAVDPPSTPVTDPLVALSAIAARTSRLRIGIMVTLLARRRPAKVARETVTLDRLSGGRLVFGVGLGGAAEEEWTAFGEPSDARTRADRVDEGLEVIAGLWSGEPFSFEGGHHHVVDAQFLPRPVQEPRIPIWVGGTWPNRRPFRRAARWDGVFPIFAGVEQGEMPSPERFAEVIAYTRSQRGAGPFDAALEGQTGGVDAAADAARVQPYVRAGLTWWVEALNWTRGSLADVRDRIRRGPPPG